MTTITLCCSPGACSRATMIVLEEIGVPYDTRVANLANGEQRAAEYLAINPKGKVPVLIVDGVPLTESVAILAWLADTYPDAALLPAEPLPRAEALSAISWLASAVLTAFGRIVRPERISAQPESAGPIRAAALADVAANLALAEARLAGRSWWVGPYSVADPYLYYIVCNAADRFGLDLTPYPALVAHRTRMEGRPATQRMRSWEERARATLTAAA